MSIESVRLLVRCCWLTVLVLLASCSVEGPREGGAPSPPQQTAAAGAKAVTASAGRDAAAGTIQMVPQEGSPSTLFSVAVQGTELSGGSLQWLVNGAVVPGVAGMQFKPSAFKKGDSLQVRLTRSGGDLFSNIVILKNAPPEFTRVKMMPEVFRPGDVLSIEAVATDPEGDPVTIRYEWTRNGQPAGSGRALEGPVKRGDHITIKITPCDREGCGNAIHLTRDIVNMPPSMTDDGRYEFDGTLLTKTVKAVDPDDDPLTFSLKSAPSGMTIDQKTGRISWHVPEEFSGKTSFTVVASDGKGGEASQTFNFTVR